MSDKNKDKTGIPLERNDTVNLDKEGRKLQRVCVGVNWGSIPTKGLFNRLLNPYENVDLDTSAAMYTADKNRFDLVFYKHLRSNDKSIKHSGDDLTGDIGFDDSYDNEVLDIKLDMVDPSVKYIVFFLNSFKKHHFGQIPYSKIRIFEGKPHKPTEIFATFNLSVEERFQGKITMVMGKITRLDNGDWKFDAIGEPLDEADVNSSAEIIAEQFLG